MAASLLVGGAAWPQHTLRLVAFGVAAFAAVLAGLLDPPPSSTREGALPPLSFAFQFAALILFGADATLVIAASTALARAVVDRPRLFPVRHTLLELATGLAAIKAADAAIGLFGGTGYGAWPEQALPIAAGVLAYGCVAAAMPVLVRPLATRTQVADDWVARAAGVLPPYAIAASLAVTIVEVAVRRDWAMLPVVAVPAILLGIALRGYAVRAGADARRRQALLSASDGIAIVDRFSAIRLWNGTLERLLNCPAERAIGRSLNDAVPALRDTVVPGAVLRALAEGANLEAAALEPVCIEGAPLLHVEIVPDAGGVLLVWRDATERVRADRLALAADGANDGLWEWDLRTGDFHASARFRAILGVPAQTSTARIEQWFDRVHREDVVLLREAIEAQVSGRTERLELEIRIHVNGTAWRRFLCRAVTQPSRGRRATWIAGSLSDVTERAIAQERMQDAGLRDPLTGLFNRSVFVEGLGHRLSEFKKAQGARFAVLYLDLDRFKVVNDSLGHLVGDELLTAVSRRLESCLRPADALARLGGDEFAILLSGLHDETQANAVALRIQKTLAAPFAIGGREVFTSASIGIACCRAEYTNPEEIMRDADTAMYHAKAHGKARHELFDADMHARELDRLGLESDLRHAVENLAFEVHFQPIVTLSSRMCAGFEALVRWKRNGKAISPMQFIPVAEELGLIEPLGTWVLQESCRMFAEWQRRFPDRGLECITVNVSTRQLMQQGFAYLVEKAVRESGMKPRDLRLEITETALMHAPHLAAQVLRDLRNFGVKIYLDDFGTGYSSLSHLHKLPVDALKIDSSFVRSLLVDDRPAIVESILALARTLHTSVVAEGVESDRQARELERLGCRQAQGFYFSPPMTPAAVEEMLAAGRPLGDAQSAAAVPRAVAAEERGSAPVQAPWRDGVPARDDVPRYPIAAPEVSAPRSRVH